MRKKLIYQFALFSYSETETKQILLTNMAPRMEKYLGLS